MISFNDVHKRFGEIQVLDGVSLDINSGGVFAILGPNGSGKTTLIKCLLGMVLMDSGDIKIENESLIGAFDYRHKIDYLPQIARFPDNITVAELIRMIKDLRGKESRDEELKELFGLQPFMGKKLGNLSGGTRQKVNIVLAFMFDSPILVLDEPTTGLDPVSLLHLKDLIRKEKEKGKTILVTTHIMSFVEEMADEIVFLLEGKVYFRGKIMDLEERTGETDLERAIAHLLKENHAEDSAI